LSLKKPRLQLNRSAKIRGILEHTFDKLRPRDVEVPGVEVGILTVTTWVHEKVLTRDTDLFFILIREGPKEEGDHGSPPPSHPVIMPEMDRKKNQLSNPQTSESDRQLAIGGSQRQKLKTGVQDATGVVIGS
jgi:hypothetical protein